MEGMAVGIIGAGLAGLRMAAELRERGESGAITVWDAEGRAPYDRPPLSKELFGQFIHPLSADGLGDIAELGVAVVPRAASAIRPAEGGWRVDGADSPVFVEHLVIATGAAPRATIPGARVLYTADDAAVLRELIVPGAKVHIVGAGWIGTEIASAAAGRGAAVEVWEATAHILERTFHGAVDSLWKEWLAAAGVALHLGEMYETTDRPDVLVQATGARPNLTLVTASPDIPACELSARGALVTDLHGRVYTTAGHPIAGLYAVGDCADVRLPDGSMMVGGHWTGVLGNTARAAAALTGTQRPRFLDPPEVFSTQFGHEIALVGVIPDIREPRRADTQAGFTLRWESGQQESGGTLQALLAVDSPRELSRARRELRRALGAN